MGHSFAYFFKVLKQLQDSVFSGMTKVYIKYREDLGEEVFPEEPTFEPGHKG